MLDNEQFEGFVEAWGSMGILWGINRSMARIHAYLMLQEEPVDSETIADELAISRGNTSMCLKDLRNWGVIQRVHQAGDRRDLYVIEPDIWTMLHRIATGRISREFDPAYTALEHFIEVTDAEKNAKVSKRLKDLEEIMATIKRIFRTFLESEQKSRGMVEFLKRFVK